MNSEAMTLEVEQTPDMERRNRVELLLRSASLVISIEQIQVDRAKELQALGFQAFDALHVACAEGGKVDVLLTTDDRLMRLAARVSPPLRVRVVNPLIWIQEISQP